MFWKVKVLTYIKQNLLFKLFLKDIKFFIKIANYVFNEYYPIYRKKIVYDNVFLQFINIYPQIKFLEVKHLPEKYEVIKIISNYKNPTNRYILNGESNSSFIYSNYVIPHPTNSSIPFSIGIFKNNIFKILTSNIFYFEIYLDPYNFRHLTFPETLLIGFTNAEKSFQMWNFGYGNTFGLNVFENRFEIDSEQIKLPFKLKKGDTIGIGLKYIEKFKYEIFLTKDGRLKDIYFKNNSNIIFSKCKLKVIINLNLSSGIDINFGHKEFMFDLEKIIKTSKIINSTKNNFINSGFNLNEISSDEVHINGNYSEYIYNLLQVDESTSL